MPNLNLQDPAKPGGPPDLEPTQTQGIVGAPSETQWRILRARQSELSGQHQSVTDRRESLARELQSKTGADRAGLEAQLAVLDKRLIQIETDLADVGRQVVAAAPASLIDPPVEIRYQGYDEADIFVAVFWGAFVMFALFVPFLIRSFRRRKHAPTGSAQPVIGVERLDRMEQAIDTIAVEIERVSENQRFMTRLMTETQLAGSIAAVRGSTEVARAAAEAKSNV